MARPSKFNLSIKEKMLQLYTAGKTDEQVAEIVGVCVKTIHNWQGKHPDFLQALKESKQIADELVEASLFARATGYSHESEKVFCTKDGDIVRAKTVEQYAPDTTAAIFWLKNRKPKDWRDKTEIDLNSAVKKTDKQLDARIAELVAKLETKEGE